MPAGQYNLTDEKPYQRWREAKLAASQGFAEQRIVSIKDPYALSHAEKHAIIDACNKNNFVIYQLVNADLAEKTLVCELGRQLGLHHLDNNLRADEDSVTSLEVKNQTGNQYIPYTNKPLSWHCDGYYNALDRQIGGIIMHCVTPAETGGENELIDHEMMYIRLRDENPALIEALMRADAMIIPANIEAGVEIRAEQAGPVFSVNPVSGQLHMRYSARKRNIRWREDEVTKRASHLITDYLADESMVFRHRLNAGQGIVCNNVLHNRSAFADSKTQKRLMYRARYYDRVNGDVNNIDEINYALVK